MTSQTSSPQRDSYESRERFSFGRNWQEFVDTYLDEERIGIAEKSLDDLLPEPLSGKTFLDIGCGSGLFSFCANRKGARVLSVDVDPDAIACTSVLRTKADATDEWEIREGSILDDEFVGGLPTADVVYSWGVLHHTGDMYRAIENAASKVSDGGLFVIAIYNDVREGRVTSAQWLRIKRRYNRSPRWMQVGMVSLYGAYWAAAQVRNRRNPIAEARAYRRHRGMALWTDLVDWVGGLPFEYATADEITAFCEGTCGMRVERTIAVSDRDTGNNQFVFRKLASEA